MPPPHVEGGGGALPRLSDEGSGARPPCEPTGDAASIALDSLRLPPDMESACVIPPSSRRDASETEVVMPPSWECDR